MIRRKTHWSILHAQLALKVENKYKVEMLLRFTRTCIDCLLLSEVILLWTLHSKAGGALHLWRICPLPTTFGVSFLWIHVATLFDHPPLLSTSDLSASPIFTGGMYILIGVF